MIAKGKAVSHEAALMEYAMAKKDAEYVTSHGLLSSPVLMLEPSAQEILDEFRQHRLRFTKHTCGRKLDDTILRFELCPTAEETAGWSRDDWIAFIHEFIRILDSLSKARTKQGFFLTPRTNLARTQWAAFLHHDGADGCDHIHLLGNRIDLGGNTISDAFLMAKAEMAANIINERRGWTQSMDIGRQHRAELKEMCYDVLRQMPRWDWDDYFHRISARGYQYFRRYDSDGNQRGYSIFYGNASIPANEIARGLTYGKIEATWRSLHPVVVQQRPVDIGTSTPGRAPQQNLVWYDLPMKDRSFVPDGSKSVCISKRIDSIIHDEITMPDVEDYKDEEGVVFPVLDDVIKVAITLFLGYLDAATAMSESHGGGGGSTSGWGRDRKDDDEDWARRCARLASRLCTPAHRTKRRTGGYHR